MQPQEAHKLLLEGVAAAKLAQQKLAIRSRNREQNSQEIAQYRERARTLLQQVVDNDQTNINAWLWLSTVMDDLADKARCLENVLALEADNKQALAGLDWISRRDPAIEINVPIPPQQHVSTNLVRMFDSELPPYEKNKRPIPQSFMGEDVAEPLSADQTVTPQGNCPFCSQAIISSDTVCPHCNLPLVMDCPACNTLMDVEWESCHECGYLMGNHNFGSMYFAQLALGYQQNKQTKKAMNAIEIAEKMDPDQPDLYRIKGEIQHELGQIHDAIITLEKAVEREPEHVAPYISLGKVLKHEGKWRQAKEIFQEAMGIAPKSSEPYYAMGDLMWQQQKTREARKYLQRALKLDPMHGLAWARLGEIFEASRKRAAATEAYHQAFKLLPRNTLEWEQVENRLNALDPLREKAQKQSWGRSITGMFKLN